ncbi:PREDICTED: wall-associated receptor kinase 2-like [Nelumbo nucifera]|uniref:Wall-associated receptor kinase 5-like n=2 Tax=Nelumbo nucifera TaxID=4432 RepID=A0A822Z7K8_NELNU|nr:PREDICTED: wall-associated receptor kinase 2-like [Nelumbo nucifera]DAD39379.1 TPA_asm: hypothetical protein HUJ06_013702 [Nelumbo nucifera]
MMPRCQDKCGNVSIPYPFGLVGDAPSCYRDEFKLFCNTAVDPPQLLLYDRDYWTVRDQIVLNISLQGQLTFSMLAAVMCYTVENKSPESKTFTNLPSAYRFSHTRNKFTAIGCNTVGIISDHTAQEFHIGCISFCPYRMNVMDSSCDGIGCCQSKIPKDLGTLNLTLENYIKDNGSAYTWNISRCNFGFLSDEDWFSSNASSLWNSRSKVEDLVDVGFRTPVVLDWAIRDKTCNEAQREKNNYTCGKNAYCSNSSNGPGYLCHCKKGYQGNPYLPNGCQDIDECEVQNPCREIQICVNTIGSFNCTCPPGTHGIDENEEMHCVSSSHKKFPVVEIASGIATAIALAVLIPIGFQGHSLIQKRKQTKLRQKFFKQNGGLLLQQKFSTHEGNLDRTKIFVIEELERATDNFSESRILGKGGFGTVYKGMLSDGKIVAVKKSKIVDENQVDQFINEVIILAQINHRNIVSLFGCCLETQVPLLVYEFVSNGTLSHHLHDDGYVSSLSWKTRLRIAIQVAEALAYLHFAASIPIFHRDIKPSNILLDENYNAKVADFGISRSIPVDKTHLTTVVQGTFGYLDPEYFHSGQFTDKSDVYSFGVILVELLTGKRVMSSTRPEEEKSIVMHFISSTKGNNLFDILETRVVNEGEKEKLLTVAKIAKQCLKLNGKKRPTMKEVAASLEGLRRFEDHPQAQSTLHEERWLADQHLFQYNNNETEKHIDFGSISSITSTNHDDSCPFLPSTSMESWST